MTFEIRNNKILNPYIVGIESVRAAFLAAAATTIDLESMSPLPPALKYNAFTDLAEKLVYEAQITNYVTEDKVQSFAVGHTHKWLDRKGHLINTGLYQEFVEEAILNMRRTDLFVHISPHVENFEELLLAPGKRGMDSPIFWELVKGYRNFISVVFQGGYMYLRGPVYNDPTEYEYNHTTFWLVDVVEYTPVTQALLEGWGIQCAQYQDHMMEGTIIDIRDDQNTSQHWVGRSIEAE